MGTSSLSLQLLSDLSGTGLPSASVVDMHPARPWTVYDACVVTTLEGK